MQIEVVDPERVIYNPAHEAIRELYSDDDRVLLDLMFTWNMDKALQRKKELERQNKKVIVDGIGSYNLGFNRTLDWDAIENYVKANQPCDKDYQVTKMSAGCPMHCEFCYSLDFKFLGIPKIKRNYVKFTDENILAIPNIIEILDQLREIRVENKVVYYEAICGFDYRLLDFGITSALKNARFKKPRIAWDFGMKDKGKIFNALKSFINAGYKSKEISVFMVTNWKISFQKCMEKLYWLYHYKVKVNDCCFDCSYKTPIPKYWSLEEIRTFRHWARATNHLVSFGKDPQPYRW